MTERPSGLSLSRDRDFWLFAGGQGVSAVGDSLTLVALPLVVLTITGSGVQTGLVALLTTLPMLLLGLPAGALADRWDRRKMMLWSDVGRAVLLAAVPVAAAFDVSVMVVLYAICVPIGVLRALFEAACQSCVPSLVGRERLAQANATLAAANAVGFLAGPALAGIMVVVIGGPDTLGIDAATFAVSALSLALMRRSLQSDEPADEGTMREQVRDGLHFVRDHRGLRTVIGYWALLGFLVAPLVTSATYLAQKDLEWRPSTLGLLLTVYAAGSIVGAVLAPRLMARPLVCLYASGAFGAVAILVLAWSGWIGLTFAVAAFAGAGEGVAGVTYNTTRAALTPERFMGRVTAAAQVLNSGLRSVALGLGGVALSLLSGRGTLTVMGVGCLVLTVVAAALSREDWRRRADVGTPVSDTPSDPVEQEFISTTAR